MQDGGVAKVSGGATVIFMGCIFKANNAAVRMQMLAQVLFVCFCVRLALALHAGTLVLLLNRTIQCWVGVRSWTFCNEKRPRNHPY